MTKEEQIKLIAGRIRDEYRKHPDLDWAEIAASKLQSQWSEFYGAVKSEGSKKDEVKRYDLTFDEGMKENPTGDYVDYEDYQQLKSKRDKLREALEKLKSELNIHNPTEIESNCLNIINEALNP